MTFESYPRVKKIQDGSQSLHSIAFRIATVADAMAMAALCAHDAESQNYWRHRIVGYLKNEFNPYQSLVPRYFLLATAGETVVGFIAGHMTSRNEHAGQVQWICVEAQYQRMGIGTLLLQSLFTWFFEHGTASVRVDIEPHQTSLRQFYTKNSAEALNKYWLYWKDVKTVM
jgi:ribosomal protein S18 acetylase RimI-like enzyme